VRLCLDEHYSPRIAAGLRERGQDVDCVKERPELMSLDDPELLAQMATERRALLTENVIDFMPLIRQWQSRSESHYGVVFSSPQSMPRSRNTIGTFIERVARVMERYPGAEDFRDHIEWL
jgi:hypothetical protein